LTLGFACVAAFMSGVDQTVVTIALPAIQRDLGASGPEVQWLITGYSVAFAALMIAGGTIGDRYGRKRVFLAGMSLFTLGSACAALAPNIGVLIAARVLSGVGAAFMVPTTLALIASVYPPDERGRAIGIWAATSGLAVAFGPMVGGALVQSAGWEWVFWINVPVGIVAVLAGARLLGETAGEERTGHLDVPGLALVVPGLFALTYAITAGGHDGFGNATVLACLAAAIVLLVAFAAWERRSPAPMVRAEMVRRRRFLGPLAVLTVMYFALIGILVYLSLYYQSVRGYSPLTAALFFLPTTVVVVICAPVAGGLADRLGPRRFGVLGALCVAASLGALVGLGTDTAVWVLLVSQLLLGLGVGLADPPLSATILSSVDVEDAGVASATEGMVETLGGALGVAILGALAGAFSSSAFSDAIGDSALSAPAKANAVAAFEPLQLPPVPAGGSAAAQAAVDHAAQSAFASGLGSAALVGALLCLVAAALAYFTIAPKAAPAPDPDRALHPARIRHHLGRLRLRRP
jgi:EmrB/QacA subfamily drug resistance transporter